MSLKHHWAKLHLLLKTLVPRPRDSKTTPSWANTAVFSCFVWSTAGIWRRSHVFLLDCSSDSELCTNLPLLFSKFPWRADAFLGAEFNLDYDFAIKSGLHSLIYSPNLWAFEVEWSKWPNRQYYTSISLLSCTYWSPLRLVRLITVCHSTNSSTTKFTSQNVK